MKKTILLLLATLSLLSCSKSDDNNGELEISYQALKGMYYMDSAILTDGTVKQWTSKCTTKKDYVEIFEYAKIVSYFYAANCTNVNNTEGCTDFYLDVPNRRMENCNFTFDGKIASFTSTTLQIDYDGGSHYVGLGGIGAARSLILKRF
jgi:hypothetical protein